MRTIFVMFLSLISLGIRSEELAIDVTEQGLSGWQLVGQPSNLDGAPGLFCLAADSQLFRTFTAESISIEVSSRPVFGVESTDWPVLEIGADALVFARLGDKGRLVLAGETRTSFVFPLEFDLEESGESRGFVLVTIERSGQGLSVSVAGSSWQFSSAGPNSGEVEIVASSGQKDAWLFDSLSVHAQLTGTAQGVPDRIAGNQPDEEPRRATLTGHENLSRSSASLTSTETRADLRFPVVANAAVLPTRTSPKKSGLEIFTPPSVRHGRPGAARADAAQLLNQQPEGVR
jgi:hypothetical protein